MPEAVIEVVTGADGGGAAWARALAAPAERGVRLRSAGAETAAEPRRDAARVLAERMAPRGFDQEAVAAALREPLLAALARLLGGQTAGLIAAGDETAAQAAWRWLEPAAGGALARLRVGRGAGAAEASFAWAEAVIGAPAAAGLSAAATWLMRALARPVAVAVVSFAGGVNPRRGEWEETWRALRARAAAAPQPVPPPQWIELYSPLFYPDGQLQAGALLETVARKTAPALPLIWAPRVPARELAAALASQGGALSGTLLAGAERPVASLGPGASAAEVEFTVTAMRAATAAASEERSSPWK